MDDQNSFLSAYSFLLPESPLLSTSASHAPFVFWLAATLKPRRIAVAATADGAPGLPLDEAVRRTRSAMDDVDPAGPIDLLHLSIGSDATQATRLLDRWRPLLGGECVLLIHGAIGPDACPSPAFAQLAAGCPYFLFPHGLGLGIVAAGSRVPTALTQLFSADLASTRAITSTYAALGACVANRLIEAGKGANAQRLATTAKRGLLAKRRETDRRRAEAERAAAGARNRVVTLASTAEARHADEYAARDTFLGAQARIDALATRRWSGIRKAGDPWDLIRFGPLRRWRARALSYTTLLAELREAASALSAAQVAYDKARARRELADRDTIAAEPRASALEGAAAALRDELSGTDTILSSLAAIQSDDDRDGGYARWVELHDTLTIEDRAAIRIRVADMKNKPLISIVVPVYSPSIDVLRQTIASVRAQLYPHWELCMADDASPDPAVFRVLQDAAAADSRIRIVRRTVNGHISAASNSALELARGEFIALLDHDDLLPEHSLFEVAAALNEDPDLDIIYSDEDHIDGTGHRFDPYFKPDYNHDLMLGQNLINHLGVYRRSLVQAIGGFRLGFEGSQDYDLALRAIDASHPRRIHHIPAILYHWRSTADAANFSEAFLERCLDAARRALEDHLVRRGETGIVTPHPSFPLWHRVRRRLPEPAPLVSIIVPTKDGAALLRPCCDGILNRTAYPAIELIIIDHESTDPETLDLLAELSQDQRVRVLQYEGPFNYSAINNAAAAQAGGSVLALLNNDVDVIHPEWLAEMVALAALPEVGAVGAKLLYPDGHVQHAGVLLGPGGVASHMFHQLGRNEPGYSGRALMTAAVSAVTAACLVVRKSVFEEVGGFDAEALPVAFNDVDLCLRIGQRGYRNVWCAHAELHHHESVSRGSDEVPERIDAFQREITAMKDRWGDLLRRDPAYNPNLDLASGDFSPAFPPRRAKIWQDEGVALSRD